MGIRDARRLHECLNHALASSTDVVLDASRIERVDTAVLQVLVGFARALRERGCRLAWHSPSPELLQAARVLGLEQQLEMNS